jgi:2-dehydro-3-deoxygluconokinase
LLTALLYTNHPTPNTQYQSPNGYTLLRSRIHDINGVVDPSGVGDAFMAGMLHCAFQPEMTEQYLLDYALAAAAMKNTIIGDFNLATDDEILAVL